MHGNIQRSIYPGSESGQQGILLPVDIISFPKYERVVLSNRKKRT